MPDPADAASPCIYYLHHRQVGALEAFAAHLDRARDLGFDTVLISPPFLTDRSGDVFTPLDHDRAAISLGEDLTAPAALSTLAALCRERGLRLYLDLNLSRFSAEHPLVRFHPNAFSVRRAGGEGPIDPRHPMPERGEARPRLGDEETARMMLHWSEQQIASWIEAGVSGFRVLEAQAAAPSFWRTLMENARVVSAPVFFIAETQGLARDAALRLASAGFDAFTSSVSWWDGRAPWLVEEYQALRPHAPLIGVVEAPFGPRLGARSGVDPIAEIRRRLTLAAATGSGLIMPMGVELAARERLDQKSGDEAALVIAEVPPDLAEAVRGATADARRVSPYRGEMRLISGQGAAVTVIARADAADFRLAERVLVTVINTNLQGESPAPNNLVPGAAFDFPSDSGDDLLGPLKPGEVRLLEGVRAQPIRIRPTSQSAKAAARAPRIVIEEIDPVVPGGAFAVKRIVGETVTVEADVFMDGHEQLAVELQWRAMGEDAWTGVRMLPLENNRWRGALRLDRLGRHEFRIEAWLDRFGGYRRDLQKKIDAKVAADVDVQEGARLVAKAAERSSPDTDTALRAFADGLNAAGPAKRRKMLLAPETAALMQRADARPFSVKSAPQWIDAERLAARFSSWYELFPRSQSDSPSRHGTFEDVIARLPAIRAMGFDTLYFPPIHPIGKTNRKGRNNSLKAGPNDPGSPYAIGSERGGHEAIHHELGTFEDFRRLIGAAAEHGLEIALDFAIQCSPDHPWLKQHPGWFDWRPDGSIKYAENPPKTYEDIVNVDFYAADAIPGLWIALRDIVLLWVREGVKTFRVDNPHTKPLPFWEWMIGEVRGQHPEVIFLAEAFTHPKMMYRLAKVGFSQSYTYFTWRDRKGELADYLTELTTTAPKEFFRPHFFVNTPDINPPFLQGSGRAGFLARAALAATLSGLWGVYSGFELLEAEAVPGKEDYKDSEKYEIKPRDWTAPGNIIAEISRLNQIRKSQPALQTHLGVEFYNAWNDNILYYGKMTPGGGDMILVAVNLDPHNAQGAEMEIPLWRFGLPDEGAFAVEDLLHGARFVWRGKRQSMWLSTELPYAIWRVQPEGAR
jgi:starch synthase (maltosyl-transferring)